MSFFGSHLYFAPTVGLQTYQANSSIWVNRGSSAPATCRASWKKFVSQIRGLKVLWNIFPHRDGCPKITLDEWRWHSTFSSWNLSLPNGLVSTDMFLLSFTYSLLKILNLWPAPPRDLGKKTGKFLVVVQGLFEALIPTICSLGRLDVGFQMLHERKCFLCFLPVSEGKLQQEKEKLEKRFLRRRCLFSNGFSCCWSFPSEASNSTIRWTCWEGTMSLIIRLSLCLLNLLSTCNVIRRWLGGHLATFKWHCTSRNTRRKYYPAPASLEPLCSQM